MSPVAIMRTRRHLNEWARVLGAKTDDEAVAALFTIRLVLDDAASKLAALAGQIADAPPDDEVWEYVSAASSRCAWARADIATLAQAFTRHERGDN